MWVGEGVYHFVTTGDGNLAIWVGAVKLERVEEPALSLSKGCLSCSGTGAGERVTPPIELRVDAARQAQRQGFEVRFRIDPILTPEGWEDHYEHFFQHLRVNGVRPSYVTLGTYREKNPQLDTWREKWELPPMDSIISKPS